MHISLWDIRFAIKLLFCEIYKEYINLMILEILNTIADDRYNISNEILLKSLALVHMEMNPLMLDDKKKIGFTEFSKMTEMLLNL